MGSFWHVVSTQSVVVIIVSPVLPEKWRLGKGTISDFFKLGEDFELEFMPPVCLGCLCFSLSLPKAMLSACSPDSAPVFPGSAWWHQVLISPCGALLTESHNTRPWGSLSLFYRPGNGSLEREVPCSRSPRKVDAISWSDCCIYFSRYD